MQCAVQLAAPLGIVLNDQALAQYNHVWRFLLAVKRAKFVLEQGPHTNSAKASDGEGRSAGGAAYDSYFISNELRGAGGGGGQAFSDNFEFEDSRSSVAEGKGQPPLDKAAEAAAANARRHRYYDGDPLDEAHPVLLAAASRQLHHFKIVQAEMLHFVNNLHNYIMTRVLHSLWLELERDMERAAAGAESGGAGSKHGAQGQQTSAGLDDVIRLHRDYLSSICGHCLLNPGAAPARRAVMTCLSLVCRFQRRYDTYVRLGGEVQGQGGNTKQRLLTEMAQQEAEFRKQVKLLLRMVASITSKGMYPHLEDLLLRLNFSGYYY
jgi:hypothetical protein